LVTKLNAIIGGLLVPGVHDLMVQGSSNKAKLMDATTNLYICMSDSLVM